METLKNCPVCLHTQFKPFMKVKDFFLTSEDFTIVECEQCGFRFINPRPISSGIEKYYQSQEYFSHDTTKKNLTTRVYQFARFFNLRSKYRIIRLIDKSDSKSILDIGCGTGEFLKFCYGKGYTVSGMEPNEKPRERARDKNGIRVEATLNPYLAQKQQFGVITLWHVLEHIHDLENELERIKKLLLPGGKILLALPNCESWDAKNFGIYWGAWDVPRHLYHFSRGTIEKLGKRSGLKLEKIFPQKLDAFYVSLLSEKYQKGKSSFVNAFFSGVRSNFHARTHKNNYSSLIYIFSVEIS